MREEGDSYYLNLKVFEPNSESEVVVADGRLNDCQLACLCRVVCGTKGRFEVRMGNRRTGQSSQDSLGRTVEALPDMDSIDLSVDHQTSFPPPGQSHKRVLPLPTDNRRSVLVVRKTTAVSEFQDYLSEYLEMLSLVFSSVPDELLNSLKAFGLTRDFLLEVLATPTPPRLTRKLYKMLIACLFAEKETFLLRPLFNFEWPHKLCQSVPTVHNRLSQERHQNQLRKPSDRVQRPATGDSLCPTVPNDQ